MRTQNSKLKIPNFAAVLVLAGGAVAAPAALKSGPQVGDRPLPFTSTMVTGEYRGKQHCYVCALKDEPAVLVFARRLDEPSGRLLKGLRDALQTHQKEKLFGWFVFLSGEATTAETETERQAYEFARQAGAASVPISVLGEPQGPPGYLIAPEAEVTVLVFRSGKVLYNRAYTAKQWNRKTADAALKELPALVGSAPATAGR